MDLQDNLTLAQTGIPGGALVDTIGSSAKNLVAGIRNKAKAKKARAVAASGQYWTLRPFLKGLIPIPQYILDKVGGQGITEHAVVDLLPAQEIGATESSIIDQLKTLSGQGGGGATIGAGGVITASGTPSVGTTDIKKYLPYIIGAILLGIIIYFIVKRS